VSSIWGEGATSRVQFSGDDGIFMPSQVLSQEQKSRLVSRLSATSQPSAYRVTFLAPVFGDTGAVIPAAERSRLIVRAESVEKDLRAALDGQIPLARLQRVGFGVDLLPNADGSGLVRLLVGGEVDPAMIEQIRARAQTILPQNHRLELVQVPRTR
jgi:hypothetical protein